MPLKPSRLKDYFSTTKFEAKFLKPA